MTQPPPTPAWKPPGDGVPADATPEQLASLAATRPDLWPRISTHPNCYEGLRTWISNNEPQFSPPSDWLPPTVDPAALAAPAPVTRDAAPDHVARTPHKGRAWLAAGVAAALVLSGGGVALAMTDTWPFGQSNAGGGSAASGIDQVDQTDQAAAKPTFADGIAEQWTVTVADLGGDLMMGGWGGMYPRGFSYDGPTKWYPESMHDATLVPITDQTNAGTTLVLLSNADGSQLWSTDLAQSESHRGVGCEVNAQRDRMYCGVADGSTSELLVLDATGERARTPLTGQYSDIVVDETGVSLSGSALIVRLNLDGKVEWQTEPTMVAGSNDLTLIDTAHSRTLVRSYPGGWELFDRDGVSLVHEVGRTSDVSSGDVYLTCDATIAGDRLFLFGDCDQSITAAGMKVTRLDEVPAQRAVHPGETNTLVVAGASGTTAYDAASGATLWSEPGQQWFATAESLSPSSVMFRGSDAELISRSLASGEQLFSLDANELASSATMKQLPEAWVALSHVDGETSLIALDVTSGEQLWAVDHDLNSSLLGNESGLLMARFSPEDGRSTTLTYYAPAKPQEPAVGVASLPDTISIGCPADTILLAWAEFANGWVLVCGVSDAEPTFMAYQGSSSSSVLYSVGAQQPTGADAKAAVHWDAGLSRYSAELEGGDRVTLDYDIGTAVRRDATDRKTIDQHRFVRYVFVPMSEQVRTMQESARQDGAFDVQAPEDTAKDQVRYMIEVLEKAYAGRALVKDALPKLQYCTASAGGYEDTVSAMETVRDNRAELLSALDAMPVDKIPEGNALLDDLYDAIDASHRANVEYVAWAEAANASGCASLSSAGERAAAASDPPKDRFAERWNRAVAPKFGVRTFDAWYI